MQPGDVLPRHPWTIEKHSLKTYLFKSKMWNAEDDMLHGPTDRLTRKQKIYKKVMKDNEDEDWDTKLNKYFTALDIDIDIDIEVNNITKL